VNAAEALEAACVKAIRARSRQLVAGYPYSEIILTVRYDGRTGLPTAVRLGHASAVAVDVGALCGTAS